MAAKSIAAARRALSLLSADLVLLSSRADRVAERCRFARPTPPSRRLGRGNAAGAGTPGFRRRADQQQVAGSRLMLAGIRPQVLEVEDHLGGAGFLLARRSRSARAPAGSVASSSGVITTPRAQEGCRVTGRIHCPSSRCRSRAETSLADGVSEQHVGGGRRRGPARSPITGGQLDLPVGLDLAVAVGCRSTASSGRRWPWRTWRTGPAGRARGCRSPAVVTVG